MKADSEAANGAAGADQGGRGFAARGAVPRRPVSSSGKKFSIERGVPVPLWRGHWTELAEEMVEGDSVKVSTRGEALSLRHAIMTRGYRPVMRKGGGGWRVWKVKKEME